MNWLMKLRKLGQISPSFYIFASVRRCNKRASNEDRRNFVLIQSADLLWCGSAKQIVRNDNGICERQRYFTKVNKQSCGKMPKTTTLSKCAMQSFFGQFHQLKNFFVENRSFSQMLPRRFAVSALVRRKSKLRGWAFPEYRCTYYDTQVA